mgnify:CR=1 FL=1|jgi:hypothetical protein
MRSDEIVDPNRGSRIVIYILGVSVILAGVGLCALVQWSAIPLILYTIVGMVVMGIAEVCFPYVVMSREGILVRNLLMKKNYKWDEIKQAGKYWRNRKSPAQVNFSFVLVCPNGSPKRTGRDRLFLERNLWKAISLPNEREIRLFITEHYGPLDFDDYKGLGSYEKKLYKLDET